MLCVVLTACISTDRKLYVDEPLQPTPAETPIRIIDLSNFERPFETIGHVGIKAAETYSPQSVMRRLQSECRKMGGDALNDVTQKPLQKKFPRFFDYLNFYDVIWTAEVVRWRE
jgi:hypothetical protein